MTIAPAIPGQSPRTIRLAVDGMTCGACAARVSKALEAVPGVESAQVSLMLKEASAPIIVQGRHWGGLRLAFQF